MTIPQGAKFEATLSDEVVLYDVSDLLPQHPIKKYKRRDPNKVKYTAVHKSGADGPDGYKGLHSSAMYVVAHRNWPGFPYTVWLSRVPDRLPNGQMVVYRGQKPHVRSYHTGGDINTYGYGIGVQGNYDGDWNLLANGLPHIAKQPTEAQYKMLEAVVMYFDTEVLTGHWEAGTKKKVCPGDALRKWVLQRRGDLPEEDKPPTLPSLRDGEVDLICPNIEALQRALSLAGFVAGPIDGIWGMRSRLALERFQEAAGIRSDGWYGPETAEVLIHTLRAAGKLKHDTFWSLPVRVK